MSDQTSSPSRSIHGVDPRDHVATALRDLVAGEALDLHGQAITARADIPKGHKIAVRSAGARRRRAEVRLADRPGHRRHRRRRPCARPQCRDPPVGRRGLHLRRGPPPNRTRRRRPGPSWATAARTAGSARATKSGCCAPSAAWPAPPAGSPRRPTPASPAGSTGSSPSPTRSAVRSWATT